MAYIVTKSAPVRTPPPTGTLPATCIRFIDLGTQTDTWQGKTKIKPKIMLIWELIGTKRDDGTPHIISKKYTASFGEKSNLFQDLKNWLTDETNSEEFDVISVLGKSCFINIAHEKSKDSSQVYGKAQGILALPAGYMVAPPQSTPKAFELSNPDWELFAEFSDYTKDLIRKSPEYAALDLPENAPPPIKAETPVKQKMQVTPQLLEMLSDNLKSGAMTLETLLENYELTEEQLSYLKDIDFDCKVGF